MQAEPQTVTVAGGFDQYVTTEFVVSLKQGFLTIPAEYDYTVMAIAQGGASAEAPGMMEVTPAEYDCTQSQVVGAQSLPQPYYIPREGQETPQVVFASSAAYVTPPAAGCFQSFELTLVGGAPAPSYYEFDTVTGSLRFTNSGD